MPLRDRAKSIYIDMRINSIPEMAKTIAIADEVYDMLKKSKLPGESFSSVIRRSLHKGKLTDIAGSLTISKTDWASARRRLSGSSTLTSMELTASH